jgi:hypothetical protein
MARALFLIFNHHLTQIQKDDARLSLDIRQLVKLPPDLEQLWCQIPPDLPEIDDYLAPIKTWLSHQASKSDYVLIQGDFGATFIMVNFALEMGLIPVYSTSWRNAVEEHKDDGSVKLVHQFNHQIFRKYGE